MVSLYVQIVGTLSADVSTGHSPACDWCSCAIVSNFLSLKVVSINNVASFLSFLYFWFITSFLEFKKKISLTSTNRVFCCSPAGDWYFDEFIRTHTIEKC